MNLIPNRAPTQNLANLHLVILVLENTSII